MATFADMIRASYPDAVEGRDFELKTGYDGNTEIGYWNEAKLGPEPDIIRLHASYMRMIAKRKERIPTLDASDPAPWLNASGKKEEPPAQQKPEEKVINVHRAVNIPLVHVDPYSGFIMEGKK